MDAITQIPQFAVATLSIGGMTCSSCSNSIQHGLAELLFVKDSTVSALAHSGTVVFDQTHPTAIAKIVELIEDKGYDCTVQSVEPLQTEEKHEKTLEAGTRTIKLVVDGMFCNYCPSRITESLSRYFGERIEAKQSLGYKDAILSISYRPDTPSVTVRSIISHLQSVHPSFRARPYQSPSAEDRSRSIQRQEQKTILWRLIIAFIIAIPTFFVGVLCQSLVPETDSIHQWLDQSAWAGNASRSQWILFILATPVYFISASGFHIRAGKEIYALWQRRSNAPLLQRFYRFGSMSLLISAGTTVAYVASIALLIVSATTTTKSNSSTYFDSVVFLTFFILTGRYLEALSKAKAGDAVSMLGQLRPEKALLVVPLDELSSQSDESAVTAPNFSKAPSHVQEVSVDLLEIGDTVIVPRGSTPPADGILASAEGQFDESSLTGESRAVKKATNDKIFLGTINTGNPVKVVITDIGGSSMLDQIIAVVREGQTKRAPVERIADSITAYFVPVITLLAILTFFIWLGLGQSGVLNQDYLGDRAGGWAFWALEFAIAVFVVACPCGIGLAAPTALYVGTGLAAKASILVRGGGEAFQDASHLDAIVFDKTGTLTEGGDLQVTDCEVLANEASIPDTIAWSMALTLEESSSHPIAKAISLTAAKHKRVDIETIDISEIPGQGMRGSFASTSSANGTQTFEAILGSESLVHSLDSGLLDNNTFAKQLLSAWKNSAKSVAILAIRETTPTTDTNHRTSAFHIAILFALSDPIRPSSASVIAALQSHGIKTYMLSGDNPETARAVALAIGIPVTNVFAGALPQDKARRIEALKQDLARRTQRSWFSTQTEERLGRVAFVGDGINDAPALLASTVSISLSTGSPVAMTSSSFILLNPSLDGVLTLLGLSKKVFRRIQWNFAWALIYNIVLIPVAAGVLFRVKDGGFILGPVWASAAMALSSVSVILASLAMRWGF